MLQLIHLLLPNPLNPPPVELQVSSLRVLEILIDECAPCMPRWKFTILDGVGRCWVTLKDSGSITSEPEFVTVKVVADTMYLGIQPIPNSGCTFKMHVHPSQSRVRLW